MYSDDDLFLELINSKSSTPGDSLHELQLRNQRLISRIKEQLVGQDKAVEQVVSTFNSHNVSAHKNRPRASFLLVGPTESGKSFLAKTFAQTLDEFHQPFAVLEIDMSALQHASQSAQLDGNEPTYSNAKPGKLTDFVRRNPQALIILKNMDKAEPALVSRLSSIFTQGVLIDQFGFYPNNDAEKPPIAPAEVDFSQTVVVVTTECGKRLYDDASFWRTYETNPSQAITLLKSELMTIDNDLHKSGAVMVNMFSDNDIIPFRRLKGRDFEVLFKRGADDLCQLFSEQYGIEVRFTDLTALARIMISRDVPDVSPARVGALLEDDILKQLFDRKEINLQQVKAIEFKLGSDSQLLWEQLNIESQQTDWLLQLVRTNQYVSFNWSLTQSDATVTIGLDNAQLNKRLAVNDIRGAGAVRLEVPDVSFSDIAGHHAVKEQLTHVVELLRAPEKIAQFGGTVSKGMLLYGPPGTGKTMLAKALAHEANLPVMSLVATEFADVEMIRETFARARRYAPSILFIDEIDAVGSRQKDGHPGLINTLLAEIDGFDTGLHSPVFVIAATNLPENIDPALLRSGRIDLHIEVPDLDRDARAYFIDKILALPLSEPVDRQTLLDLSIGMTGADLSRALSQLAARLTVNQDNGLTEDAIVSLIHQYRFGKVRSVKRSQQVRTLVAYHEAGHAVVSALLNPANKVSIINIIAREHRAGFVAFNTEPGYEQQRRVTYTECIEDIAVLLAGRLAEAHYAPGLEPCAGASDDLAKATQLAEYAISELGLDAQLGIISLQGLPDYYRPAFTAQVVERIESWMTEAQKLCDRVLTENWELVERVATVLLAQEVISGRQFYELIEG